MCPAMCLAMLLTHMSPHAPPFPCATQSLRVNMKRDATLMARMGFLWSFKAFQVGDTPWVVFLSQDPPHQGLCHHGCWCLRESARADHYAAPPSPHGPCHPNTLGFRHCTLTKAALCCSKSLSIRADHLCRHRVLHPLPAHHHGHHHPQRGQLVPGHHLLLHCKKKLFFQHAQKRAPF